MHVRKKRHCVSHKNETKQFYTSLPSLPYKSYRVYTSQSQIMQLFYILRLSRCQANIYGNLSCQFLFTNILTAILHSFLFLKHVQSYQFFVQSFMTQKIKGLSFQNRQSIGRIHVNSNSRLVFNRLIKPQRRSCIGCQLLIVMILNAVSIGPNTIEHWSLVRNRQKCTCSLYIWQCNVEMDLIFNKVGIPVLSNIYSGISPVFFPVVDKNFEECIWLNTSILFDTGYLAFLLSWQNCKCY